MLPWVVFLTGAAIAISPGVLTPTAPLNGLSILGVSVMLGAFLFMTLTGGEEDDF